MASDPNSVRLFQKLLLPLAGLLAGTLLACSCNGQVVLSNCRAMTINTPYVELLEKMEGEGPTCEMFASQDVRMTSFLPRENADSNKGDSNAENADNDSAAAIVDIASHSHEFGFMQFVMLIEANDKVTTIDVCLVKPAGMVLGQWYRYTISPLGEDASSVHIKHLLIIELKQRRLRFVNRIIEKVTCKKASEQIEDLSDRMACAVLQIGTRQIPEEKEEETQEEETQDEDAPAQDEEPTASQQKTQSTERTPVGQNRIIESKPAAKTENAKDNTLDLTVTVTGVKSARGELRIALYNSKQQYKAHDARKPEASQGTVFKSAAVKINSVNKSKATYVFKNVPGGRYAIGAFHDKDGNKKLNSNMLGLPSEPYGFSRDGRGTLGSPAFKDVVIQFDEQHKEFKFRVK